MKPLAELLRANRSYRRFDQNISIPKTELYQWVSNLRYTNSSRNIQPLKYKIVTEAEQCAQIFKHLKWAGYLRDWDGPNEGERPTAYVIQMLDSTLSKSSRYDEGLHLSALGLQATEAGYGGCIIAAFDTNAIGALLQLPEHLKPITIMALGKPIEKIVIEALEDGDVTYYRTEDQTHHVPKRSPEEFII